VCVCTSLLNCAENVVEKYTRKLAGPEKFVIIIVPGFISVWRSSSSLEKKEKEEDEKEKGWKNCWDCTA